MAASLAVVAVLAALRPECAFLCLLRLCVCACSWAAWATEQDAVAEPRSAVGAPSPLVAFCLRPAFEHARCVQPRQPVLATRVRCVLPPGHGAECVAAQLGQEYANAIDAASIVATRIQSASDARWKDIKGAVPDGTAAFL